MYNLPYHKEKDPQVISEFIQRYPFAFLTGCGADNMPVATQAPLFLEEKEDRKILTGHLMKNTDHHKAFLHNSNVLVVFNGPNAYVSGTWYSDPYTASTWNYMSIHIKGSIRFLEGKELEAVLQKTSLHFEQYNERATTVYENLPAASRQRAMHYIVAFEIAVKEMDTVFKLSQDRDEASYHNIKLRLKQQGAQEQAIAAEMEKRTKQLFPAGTLNASTLSAQH